MSIECERPVEVTRRCPLCDDASSADSSGESCARCGFGIEAARGVLQELAERAASRLKISPQLVHANTTINELPVDSLGLLEFVTELERDYGVRVFEQAWSEDLTYADIVRMILRVRDPAASP